VTNPIDFAGQAEDEPEVVPRVADVCLGDAEVGAVIFAGHFGGYVKITSPELGQREEAAARELVKMVRRHAKPFILHTIYAGENLPALSVMNAAGIPMYRSLEASAKALAACAQATRRWRWDPARRRSQPDAARVEAIIRRAKATKPRVLLEPDARELFAAYGIAVPEFKVTTTPEGSEGVARAFSRRLALKLVSAQLLHKSDTGGVLLDVAPAEAAAAHRRLVQRAKALGVAVDGVLVTPMIGDGFETVVGGFRDPHFGPVVMFGLGGVDVEALADVAFRLAPVDTDEARSMLREIRGRGLFAARRGRGARDVEAAVDAIVRVSELMADRPDIAEVDLNPLFLLERGAAVADARVVFVES
jgi:acetyltransferase